MQAVTKALPESKVHRKLKYFIKNILKRCGFIVDIEIQIDLRGYGETDRTLDVCCIFSLQNRNYMLVFECKDRSSIPDIKKEISAWKQDIQNILKNKQKIRILSSLENTVTNKQLSKIDDIRLAFTFTDKLYSNKIQYYTRLLEKEGIVFWDNKAVKYFDRTSDTLEEWMKYEIYREFNIVPHTQTEHSAKAIEIRQPNFPTMYLLGMNPGLLLRIGYVLRRTSNKPDAYQRAINKQRIESISKFIESGLALLPNSIIIVFDDDPDVQDHLKFKNGELWFPVKYCSAWIIDGQHRVYGFIKTKYRDWSVEVDNDFKLPVVAFKSLAEIEQNRTFVNINYFQKKIDPTLFCDLATITKDLGNELTWPSLLVSELNKKGPCKDMVKTSEFDSSKAITLSSFSRYALLESLLGYNKRSGTYDGPLFQYSPFEPSRSFLI